jgi:hypothetical protein
MGWRKRSWVIGHGSRVLGADLRTRILSKKDKAQEAKRFFLWINGALLGYATGTPPVSEWNFGYEINLLKTF